MGLIIAFIGKKGSGKSTACEYLMTDNTIRINFKDALIREVKEKFPKLVQEIIDIMDKTDYDGMSPWTYERLVAEKPPLFRALLQNYGTDVCRSNDAAYWVTHYENAVKNLSDFRILTDDIRFVNEADAVRARGGVLIRIIREGLESTDTHLSEMEQDTIEADYTIKAGTKDELYTQLDSTMKLISV